MHNVIPEVRESGLSSKKKLLLVAPQLFGLLEGFSAGLVSLANYVSSKDAEVEVDLLDLSSVPDFRLRDRVAWQTASPGPLFVGVTTTTASYQSALHIAAEFKAIRPDCVVVLGGHHAGPEAEIVLAMHPQVDFVIDGEGEVALLSLIEHYPMVEGVPNLVYRVDSAGGVRRNSLAALLSPAELDQIPITFRGEGPLTSPGKFDHVTYVSARGCPLKCSFCAVANQVIRAKSVPAVIADLRYLTEELGFSRVAIEDNFFAHSPKRTKELCEAIEAYRRTQSKPFQWDCQTRVESLRDDIIRTMEEAGCEAVYIGVESLSPRQIEYLGKAPNPEHYIRRLVDRVVPELLKSSVDCFINLQVGLPVEDDTDRERTMLELGRIGQMAARAGKTITIYPMLHVVYPGTAHFKRLVADGALRHDSFESFTEWEKENEPIRRWLGERFAHGTGGIPVGILKHDKLTANQFEIDNSVFAVQKYLNDVEKIPGIRVFSYGNYLVPETAK